MEYICLKHSDLKVSRLCMGGCPMGGYGWGNVKEEDFIRAVHSAIDQEINFFDTADIYGLGKSEETLGKALKGRRDKAVIATKFGVRIEKGKTFYDNSPEWIEKAATASLKRLGTDVIDLYQIHYLDDRTDMDTILEALDLLQAKGYIRYYGLSNLFEKDLKKITDYKVRFVSFQDEYSLACRKNEETMLSLTEKLDLTPMTWGSLGQGILTGKYNRESTFGSDDRRSREIYINFHGEQLERNLEIVEVLREISVQRNKPIPAVAIRFILDYLKDSVVIAGIKKEEQLLSNLASLDWSLSEDQIMELIKVSESC